jgi:hypothetical protein
LEAYLRSAGLSLPPLRTAPRDGNPRFNYRYQGTSARSGHIPVSVTPYRAHKPLSKCQKSCICHNRKNVQLQRNSPKVSIKLFGPIHQALLSAIAILRIYFLSFRSMRSNRKRARETLHSPCFPRIGTNGLTEPFSLPFDSLNLVPRNF